MPVRKVQNPYLSAVDYFAELITNTAHLLGVDPTAIVEALVIKLLDVQATPTIDEIEWEARTYPEYQKERRVSKN